MFFEELFKNEKTNVLLYWYVFTLRFDKWST